MKLSLTKSSVLSKQVVINFIALVVWQLVGHYLPQLNLFTFVYWSAVFLISVSSKEIELSVMVVVIDFAFVIANDYLFRKFGGGIHDDEGRA